MNKTIWYNTIQYNTIQYNTIQYNTIQYNTIQYNTIYGNVQWDIVKERRTLYKIRHGNDIHKKNSNGFFANLLLWWYINIENA